MGGQVNLVMKTPKRGNFEEVILWFERQLPKLGVDLRLRSEADVRAILAEEPRRRGRRHGVDGLSARADWR